MMNENERIFVFGEESDTGGEIAGPSLYGPKDSDMHELFDEYLYLTKKVNLSSFIQWLMDEKNFRIIPVLDCAYVIFDEHNQAISW